MTPELKLAVERELARAPGAAMRAGAAGLISHYRGGGRSDATIDLSAYLAVRLPATFAAVSKVLAEVQAVRPDFAPVSVLDAGSGPGTASWAAAAIWPSLARFSMLDSNPVFLALAERLASGSSEPGLKVARFRAGEIAELSDEDRADLVIASYALAEIPDPALSTTISALWAATGTMLVLVEPGTPAGSARLKAARASLMGAGAIPVAPCTHARECPMTGSDWCHFSVRLARSRAHMHAKAASVPFEDEKFAYVALAREGAASGGARVLSPPLDQKPGITFRLCTEGKIEARHIARRDSAAYKRHRKQGWGDRLSDAQDLEDGT